LQPEGLRSAQGNALGIIERVRQATDNRRGTSAASWSSGAVL